MHMCTCVCSCVLVCARVRGVFYVYACVRGVLCWYTRTCTLVCVVSICTYTRTCLHRCVVCVCTCAHSRVYTGVCCLRGNRDKRRGRRLRGRGRNYHTNTKCLYQLGHRRSRVPSPRTACLRVRTRSHARLQTHAHDDSYLPVA